MYFDYLVIGHVTRDLIASRSQQPCGDLKPVPSRLGGTAAYAARTARAMGCRVGVVTSAGPDLELNDELRDVRIASRSAQESTTFLNIYEDERRQVVRSVAQPIEPAAVPGNWRASLVHIGPVVGECDPSLVTSFPGAFIGVTPQGWMREWDEAGHVRRCRWSGAAAVLPHADAVVLSEEDVAGDRSLVADYAQQTRCLALTQGAAGCTVYAGDAIYQIPAPRVRETDPTGAGDVFAAAFFCALHQTRDPRKAARFGNCCAARSVTRPGLSGSPQTAEVVRCRREMMGMGNDGHSLRAG